MQPTDTPLEVVSDEAFAYIRYSRINAPYLMQQSLLSYPKSPVSPWSPIPFQRMSIISR